MQHLFVNEMTQKLQKKNSPLAVMLNWQHSYISNMTYKHGNLGQTELVCGL